MFIASMVSCINCLTYRCITKIYFYRCLCQCMCHVKIHSKHHHQYVEINYGVDSIAKDNKKHMMYKLSTGIADECYACIYLITCYMIIIAYQISKVSSGYNHKQKKNKLINVLGLLQCVVKQMCSMSATSCGHFIGLIGYNKVDITKIVA